MKSSRIATILAALSIQMTAILPAAIPWKDAPPAAPASSMVLFFTGDDCALCLEAEEDVWSDPRVEQAAAQHVAVRLKKGTPGFDTLAQQHRLMVIPTTLLIRDGQEIVRLQRNVSREDHLQLLAGKAPAPTPAPAPGFSATSADKAGDASSPSLDIREVTASASGNRIEVRIRLEGSVLGDRIGAYNLFLDTDGDAATGYKGSVAQGVDALVQGLTLYRFAGTNPSEWNWTQTGTAAHTISANTLVYTLESATVGVSDHSKLRLWAGTQNDQWQDEDWAPEGAALALSGKAPSAPTAGTAPPAQESGPKIVVSDATGDAGEPATDIVAAQATFAGDVIHFDIQTAAKPDPTKVYIFIDADGSPATGFGSAERSGADFMIEGTKLYRFGGAQASDWRWTELGTLEQKPSGNWIRVSVSRSRVGISQDKPASVWFMTSDASWAPKDFAPDRGAKSLQGGQ